MSNYTFNPKYITKSDDIITESIINNLKGLESFNGIGIEKTYLIKYVGSSSIRYIGKERSKGKAEEMLFDNVKNTFRTLKSLSVFNTNTEILKEKFPSVMYRMRSQLFAILLETGIIVKV
jgi:hypothetical protein